jgi:hypothetical protein
LTLILEPISLASARNIAALALCFLVTGAVIPQSIQQDAFMFAAAAWFGDSEKESSTKYF